MQILPLWLPLFRDHLPSSRYNIKKSWKQIHSGGSAKLCKHSWFALDVKWIMAHKAGILEGWEQQDQWEESRR